MALEITLMRHGKPDLPPWPWVAPARMGEWIAGYNAAGVVAAGMPAGAAAATAAPLRVVCSTLPRALQTVGALGRQAAVVDALFREAELPDASLGLPRLPPGAWAVVLRLLWLGGYSRNCESVAAARLRAQQAARQLIDMAGGGPVLLVGHGIMNRLIAAQLRAHGWRGPGKPASGHWGASTYTY